MDFESSSSDSDTIGDQVEKSMAEIPGFSQPTAARANSNGAAKKSLGGNFPPDAGDSRGFLLGSGGASAGARGGPSGSGLGTGAGRGKGRGKTQAKKLSEEKMG